MASVATVLFTAGMLVAGGVAVLGYYSYRRWDEPGVTLFALSTILLGAGGILSGIRGLLGTAVFGDNFLWPDVAFTVLFFWIVPWTLFAFQYTGRFTRLPRKEIVLLSLPVAGGLSLFTVGEFTESQRHVVVEFLGVLFLLYVLVLLFVSVYPVVQTTYRYGHLSLWQGATIAGAPVFHLVLINSANTVTGIETEGEMAAVYFTAYTLPLVLFGAALFRYGTFDTTPAVGRIGNQAVARETDDLVFVVDNEGRLVKINESATETLDVARSASLGSPLSTVLEYETEELRDRETVALETTAGMRRYDPQVSTISDQHDRELGTMFSLRDVTDRELREQRLTVLNRVLRHNLRNKIEVVRGNAEVLDEEHEGTYAETIVETADSIAGLGRRARTIDRFVSQSGSTELDIVEAVEDAYAAVRDDREVSVSLNLPETARVETNRQALDGALESAIDNALTYADSDVEITVTNRETEYEISIADDGPGIPANELACLDAETETSLQHGTGLGLWQLKWAVMTMGGELEFDTTDGTTVSFTVPNQ